MSSIQPRERALHPDLECVLFSEAEIAAGIRSIAEQIAGDYAGEDLLLLGILKGAVHVLSDLARELDGMQPGPARLYLDCMAVSSYGNASRSSGEVRLIQDSTHAVEGRHVIIVEGHRRQWSHPLVSQRAAHGAEATLPALGGLARQALSPYGKCTGGLHRLNLSG